MNRFRIILLISIFLILTCVFFGYNKFQNNKIEKFVNLADPKIGKILFINKCGHCHSIIKNDHKIGPSLFKIHNSKVASKESFLHYSNVLQNIDLTWGTKELFKLVNLGSEYIENTNMSYVGINSKSDTSAIVKYLIDQSSH